MDLIAHLGGGIGWLASYVIPFVFVLSVVIFFHELGHFLVGRWCGVGVETFALGFGPELVGYTDKHGTRWKIAAIPLGGYVKFAGDSNGASMPDQDALRAMSAEERSRSFTGKSVGQRAAIVAAGPAANFLLATVIFAITFMVFGRLVHEPVIGNVQPGSAAERAGFVAGDAIVAIDGAKMTSFEAVQRLVSGSAGQTLKITVDRGGQTLDLTATPESREFKTAFGKHRAGILGVRADADPKRQRFETFGPLEAVSLGAQECWFIVERTVSYVGGIFTGRESGDQISGLPRIAQISGEAAKIGIGALLNLAAILSVSIGFINLFPIPVLDGGHLVFCAIEAISGKPVNEKAQEIGYRIGFALVLMLMLFATWNDILHLTTS